MNIDLYRYSLCIALTLMAFFVFRFFFGKVPDKRLFANYLRSRNLMGAALWCWRQIMPSICALT